MRTLLTAAFWALLLFAAVEGTYRSLGGLPTVTPGLTPLEAHWKVQQLDAQPAVLLIGDSRVGWGISETVFAGELAQAGISNIACAALGLPGNAISAVLANILAWHDGPATVLIAYSPASFFHFVDQMGPARHSTLTIQDILDEKIDTALRQRVYTFHKTADTLWRHVAANWPGPPVRQENWVARSFTEDGLASAVLASNDGSPVDLAAHQIRSYKAIVESLRAKPQVIEERLAECRSMVDQARARGWRLALFTMPTGPELEATEAGLWELVTPQGIADAMGLPLVRLPADADIRGRLAFVDQSHLDQASARLFSTALARATLALLPGAKARH